MKLIKEFMLPSYLNGMSCFILVKKYNEDTYEHCCSKVIYTDFTIAVWHVRAK